MGVRSKYAVVRLNMVQVLRDFAQQQGKVQQAALLLPKQLATSDDSQSVQGAAAQVLNDLMDGHNLSRTGPLPPLDDSDLGLS